MKFLNVRTCHLQLDNFFFLNLVSKNWLNDSIVGCNSPFNLVELLEIEPKILKGIRRVWKGFWKRWSYANINFELKNCCQLFHQLIIYFYFFKCQSFFFLINENLIFGLWESHVKNNCYSICESCYIWGPIEADSRQPKKKFL